ncbi:MAG: hypothetical protein ACXWV3_01440 [Flavisolibacter sp.]
MKLPALSIIATCLLLTGMNACKKTSTPSNTESSLNYGDSIFYLKSADYSILPRSGTGVYTSFPEGLDLDEATGRIRIGQGKSESGMRYRVTYTAPSGETDSTFIVVSGVNYFDKYYRLGVNDSVAYPVYNAHHSRPLPQGQFIVDDDRVAINPLNGQINLKQTWRNGFANGLNPADPWKEIRIEYRLVDASQMAENEIRVLLYYYNNMGDITQEIKDIVSAHEDMLLGTNPTIAPGLLNMNKMMGGPSAFKPRPPCVIIVGN